MLIWEEVKEGRASRVWVICRGRMDKLKEEVGILKVKMLIYVMLCYVNLKFYSSIP